MILVVFYPCFNDSRIVQRTTALAVPLGDAHEGRPDFHLIAPIHSSTALSFEN